MASSFQPPRWHTRERSGIRLDREGRWWHDGQLIEHPKLIEAFNRGLSPTDDGRFRLEFGWDWCFVEVEDAAYRVLVLDVDAEAGLSVRLSDRTFEPLNLESVRQDADGVLTCRVKRGRAKARFGRDAQFAFGELLQSEHGQTFVVVGQRRWPIALSLDD